jgi:hypothetical protein
VVLLSGTPAPCAFLGATGEGEGWVSEEWGGRGGGGGIHRSRQNTGKSGAGGQGGRGIGTMTKILEAEVASSLSRAAWQSFGTRTTNAWSKTAARPPNDA